MLNATKRKRRLAPFFINGGAGGGSVGYQIANSLRARAAQSSYLTRTNSSASNSKTWTWSAWIKRSDPIGATGEVLFEAGDTAGNNYTGFRINSAGKLYYLDGIPGSNPCLGTSAGVYIDTASWYHVLLAVDTTNATAANRVLAWVNGQAVSMTFTATYAQNATTSVNTTTYPEFIGRSGQTGTYLQYSNMLFAEVVKVDGQALTPSSFGYTDPVSGAWLPKKYTGTYGTNGAYLNFSSVGSLAALGTDSSGLGNTWTASGFSVVTDPTYDPQLDTPTNNFPTLNPQGQLGTALTLSVGNTYAVGNGAYGMAPANMAFGAGKYYWEVTIANLGTQINLGIAALSGSFSSSLGAGVVAVSQTGYWYVESTTGASGHLTYTTGTTIGFMFDGTLNQLSYTVDGTTWVTIATLAVDGRQWGAFVECYATTDKVSINFGQRAFIRTKPSGATTLCSSNLNAPVIQNPKQYFDIDARSGTGASTTISGMLFAPGMVWSKCRNTSDSNNLMDIIRGVNATLHSDTQTVESTANSVTSFNSDGVTMDVNLGVSGRTYVDWFWKKDPKAGIDIQTYTGDGTTTRTIAHSLGVVPAMIIVKCRSAGTTDWFVYHKGLTSGYYIQLDQPAAQLPIAATANGAISTSPTSTTFGFTTGTSGASNVNASGATYVAYLFSEIPNFSKFGTYTGNGLTTGNFVYCGFRPKFVMIKDITTGTTDWVMLDAVRNPVNPVTNSLYADSAAVEQTAYGTDYFLSNGFLLGDANAGTNKSGDSYIYMAFAEMPNKTALAR
jgi:hypothetical protein